MLGFSDRGLQISVNRLALVIGNGDYRKAPLFNPVNDAKDMASILKKLGFKVIHLENSYHKSMKRAIRKFGIQLRENGGVGIFYYAGHGIQVKGRNYIIPINAEIETESDVQFEAIDVGRVLGKMEDAKNDLNIVLLDACRDNPFARSFRTSSQGLARMDAPTGTLIAYATAPGSVAADGEGRNGVYTKYLLRHMVKPGIKIEDVLKRVRIDVMQESAGRQVPWESSSLTGDFYFTMKSETMAKESPPAIQQTLSQAQPKDELDRIAIELRKKREARIIKFKTLLEDLRKFEEIVEYSKDEETKYAAWGFLEEKYPEWTKSINTGDTKGIIKKVLSEDNEELFYEYAVSENERKLWGIAKGSLNKTDLETYLRKYPEGFHADEAQKHLEAIRVATLKRYEEEKTALEIKRKKMIANIAGKWLIISSPDKNTYTGVPSSTVIIHQKENKISFGGRWAHGGGRGNTIYTGTYEARRLIANSGRVDFPFGRWKISGKMSDSVNVITGTWSWSNWSGDFIMNRIDSDQYDSSKYRNVIDPRKAGVTTCFIATAVYGSPLENNVLILRQFREKWLLTNNPGKWFVNLYYRLSPPIANAIAKNEWSKRIVRIFLIPVVIFTGAAIGNPFEGCIIILFLIPAVFIAIRIRNCIKSTTAPQGI